MAMATTMEALSAATLIRLEQNDPTLTHLYFHTDLSTLDQANNGGYSFWTANSADLSRLGNALGENTHVEVISFGQGEIVCRGFRDEVLEYPDIGAFLDGIRRNSSIRILILSEGYDISHGFGYGILNGCIEGNSNFLDIVLKESNIGGAREASILISAVSRSPNHQKRMMLSECSIGNVAVMGLVAEIRMHILHQLTSLDLSDNRIGRAGCEALSVLLEDPNCNLGYLGLQNEILPFMGNDIDDSCAFILANAMKKNNKLRALSLFGNPISSGGWDAFTNVLCDRTSVNTTYLSNHRLKEFYCENIPMELAVLLVINDIADKKEVTVEKILRCHPDIDMAPFLELGLKMLPLVVTWFDGARSYVKNEHLDKLDARKLSGIFQFAKALPMMLLSRSKKWRVKRKLMRSVYITSQSKTIRYFEE